jgi:EAL domain-containing protein (putative c-di-GMP-specific phosphodiesterase class I)
MIHPITAPFPGVEPAPSALPALGARLLAATQALRARAVSWHDARGRVLWASAPAFGVEHREALRAALEAFTGAAPRSRIDRPLPDHAAAVMQRVADRDGRLLGFTMLQVDGRVLAAKGPRSDLPVPAMRLLEEFARLMSSADAPTRVPEAAAQAAVPWLAPAEQDQPVEAPDEAAVEAQYVALRELEIALHVQPLQALRTGTRLRRFEVLLRGAAPGDDARTAPFEVLDRAQRHGLGSVLDRRVVSLLVFWLRQRPDVVEAVPSTFTVNLSGNAFEEDHFLGFLEALLARAALPAGILGVEVPAALLARRAARAAHVAAALESMGCGLVIDDHRMSGPEIALLALPGLRMVKLHPALVAPGASVIEHGLVAACAQMGRVVGFHTAAKHVGEEGQLEQCRLLGVDFAQGYACARPTPIDSIDAPELVEDGIKA